MSRKYLVKFLTAQSANHKIVWLLNLPKYREPLNLLEEDHKIVNEIVKNSKSKLILGAFTSPYEDRLVGLMSFRFTKDGVKRINTVAFDKRKGIGTALVRRLCEFTSELPQYSVNVPGAVPWVRSLGMTPGVILPDGRQEHHWTSEQIKGFLGE